MAQRTNPLVELLLRVGDATSSRNAVWLFLPSLCLTPPFPQWSCDTTPMSAIAGRSRNILSSEAIEPEAGRKRYGCDPVLLQRLLRVVSAHIHFSPGLLALYFVGC